MQRANWKPTWYCRWGELFAAATKSTRGGFSEQAGRSGWMEGGKEGERLAVIGPKLGALVLADPSAPGVDGESGAPARRWGPFAAQTTATFAAASALNSGDGSCLPVAFFRAFRARIGGAKSNNGPLSSDWRWLLACALYLEHDEQSPK